MVPYEQNTRLQNWNSYVHLLYVEAKYSPWVSTLPIRCVHSNDLQHQRLSHHLCFRNTVYNCVLHNESVKINSLSWYLMAQLSLPPSLPSQCQALGHHDRYLKFPPLQLSTAHNPRQSTRLSFKSILQQVTPEGIQFSKQECQSEPRLQHHFISKTALKSGTMMLQVAVLLGSASTLYYSFRGRHVLLFILLFI